jgi:glutamate/tyrosine decarboxylase-like PLP-dependent enzyme
MKREKIYVKALKRFGYRKQINKSIEELSELIKELALLQNGASNREEIIDEIADVEIMLEQLVFMFNLKHDVTLRKRYKKERLLQRMDKLEWEDTLSNLKEKGTEFTQQEEEVVTEEAEVSAVEQQSQE